MVNCGNFWLSLQISAHVPGNNFPLIIYAVSVPRTVRIKSEVIRQFSKTIDPDTLYVQMSPLGLINSRLCSLSRSTKQSSSPFDKGFSGLTSSVFLFFFFKILIVRGTRNFVVFKYVSVTYTYTVPYTFLDGFIKL